MRAVPPRSKTHAAPTIVGAERGFTLLELLVALAIFALLAVMAYGGLNAVLNTRSQTDRQAGRLAQLQLAIHLMEQDLAYAVDRGIRDEFGTAQPAMVGGSAAGLSLELTRAGWTNPLQQQRSTLQRVGYRVADQALYRVSWPALDRPQGLQPDEARILDQVSGLAVRFLDAQGEWHEQWPLPSDATQEVPALPVAVELSISLSDWGDITRLFRVPGD